MTTLNTHMIRPGVELQWEDRTVRIQRVASQVELTSLDGLTAFQAPLVEVAAALRGTTPSEHSPQLHDIEERLSEEGLRRKREDERVLFILQTGREPSAPDDSPPAPLLDPARWPLAVRRRRLAAILAQVPRTRGSMRGFPVRAESEERRIRAIERRWAERGTLVDARYTRPRQWRTTDPVMEALLEFLHAQARMSTKTDTALMRAFRVHCKINRPDLQLPSDTTLRRRINEYQNGYAVLGASARNRISLLNVPAVSEQPRRATRPGELVLFDTTKSNVWVRDPRTEKKYRLDVTVAIDLATRCVVGLAVTHTTTKYSIGLCLADVLRPKTRELAQQWTPSGEEPSDQPFVGRPDSFINFYSSALHPEGAVVDNGKQYVADYVTAQMARNGINYEPQRSRTPTDKPQVERLFRTIKEMFESQIAGFTGGSVHERGEDPRIEQLITPGQYEHLLRRGIDIYNKRVNTGILLPEEPFVRLSPLETFDILIERTGVLPDVSFEHEWIRFLPSETATVEPSRIRVQRLDYTSPMLNALQGDADVLRNGKLRVHYDPFDLRKVWCFDAEGNLHELRWRGLQPDTKQFGIFHTSYILAKHPRKRLTNAQIEEELVDLFSSVHDLPEPEQFSVQSLAHDLRPDGTATLAALSAETRTAIMPAQAEEIVLEATPGVSDDKSAVADERTPRRRARIAVYGSDGA